MKPDQQQALDDKHLTFVLEAESYALHISHVTEIIEMQSVTPMPNSPPHVRGIINLRGRVIPVVDVRLCLGMPERPYDSRTCIVVVHEESPVGLVVDTVREVVDIEPDVIRDAPVIGEQKIGSFVIGIANTEEFTHIILDSRRMISPAENL